MNTYYAFAIGDRTIGKHSYIRQMMYNQFEGRELVNKQVIVDDEIYTFSVGTVPKGVLRDHNIRIADGVFLMYSITSRKSFDKLVKYLNLILRLKAADDVPMVIVGTKYDLKQERQVDKEELEELAKVFDRPYFEVSSKCNRNVEESMVQIIQDIKTSKAKYLKPRLEK